MFLENHEVLLTSNTTTCPLPASCTYPCTWRVRQMRLVVVIKSPSVNVFILPLELTVIACFQLKERQDYGPSPIPLVLGLLQLILMCLAQRELSKTHAICADSKKPAVHFAHRTTSKPGSVRTLGQSQRKEAASLADGIKDARPQGEPNILLKLVVRSSRIIYLPFPHQA